MKMKNKFLGLFLLCFAVLSVGFSFSAFAAEKVDVNADVSLSIDFTAEGKSVSGAPFSIYKIAKLEEDGSLTTEKTFESYPIDLSDPEGLAVALKGFLLRDRISPLDSGKTDKNGSLTFPTERSVKMKPGLYLVLGERFSDGEYNYTVEPFVVTLPFEGSDKKLSYSVNAEPKFERNETPGGPPDRYKDKTVERRVQKLWVDGGAQSLRPAEITVNLLKNGTVFSSVALNAANEWSYTWEKLSKYDENGLENEWLVVEDEVERYTVSVTLEGTVFKISNKYGRTIPGGKTTEIAAFKKWDDVGYEKKRPVSIVVTLFKNGEYFDSQTLSESGGWKYEWLNLERFDADGNEISWSVEEKEIEAYTPKVTKSGKVFVIENTYKKSTIPRTGMLWWPVPVLAAAGLFFLLLGKLFKKEERE